MIRTLALIKRRPDLERAAFREHYESVHAPLALPLMDGLVRYVRYHLDDVLRGGEGGEVGFDVLSAFWYADAESTARMMERLEGEEGRAILEDELTFMDKPANTFFPVSERLLLADGAGDEGAEQIWVLLARPEEMSRTDFSRRLLRDDWPRFTKRTKELAFGLLRDGFPVANVAPAWDALFQLRGDEAAILDWADTLADGASRMVVLRTTRHETDLST